MRMDITYYNANGTSISLNTPPYYVAGHDLRNFVWEYNAVNRPNGYGGRVSFSRPVQERIISLGIRGNTPAEFNSNALALMALTEPDILAGTPGKLYLGDQYLTCFLSVSSEVNWHSRRGNWVSKNVKLVVTEPFWHTETTQSFLKGAPEAVLDAKKYDLKYPYRYIASTSSGIITNEHYSSSPMVITIYDAADDPSITIGSNVYAVDATIVDTQRIIIDQLKRTVVSMTAGGTIQNLFDYRDKSNDIFAPIEPGVNTVVYTGDFSFDITIIQQRSEPSWI